MIYNPKNKTISDIYYQQFQYFFDPDGFPYPIDKLLRFKLLDNNSSLQIQTYSKNPITDTFDILDSDKTYNAKVITPTYSNSNLGQITYMDEKNGGRRRRKSRRRHKSKRIKRSYKK